jgi:hypothetical protein
MKTLCTPFIDFLVPPKLKRTNKMNEHKVLAEKYNAYSFSLTPKCAQANTVRITINERNRGISRGYEGHAYSLYNKRECLCVGASDCGTYKEQEMDYSIT